MTSSTLGLSDKLRPALDQADLAVGRSPERGRRARKKFGLRGDLRVNFKANHDLPLAAAALDAVVSQTRDRV